MEVYLKILQVLFSVFCSFFSTINQRFKAQEEDIILLKSEMHIHYELQRVWVEIERLKHAKSK